MSALSPNPPPFHFVSDNLPPRDRIAMWEDFAKKFVRVEVDPLPDAPFRVDLTLRSLPGLKTLAGTLGGTRDQRTPSMIAEGNNDAYLLVVLDGTAVMSQLGREVTLREGEANVGELQQQLGASQQNVSKHLGILYDAGMVSRTKSGNHARYSISDPSVFELCEQVCGGVRRQHEQLDAILQPS